MRWMWTGLGVVVGSALGILIGLLAFDDAWWALMVGAAVGIVIGAIADSYLADREKPTRH